MDAHIDDCPNTLDGTSNFNGEEEPEEEDTGHESQKQESKPVQTRTVSLTGMVNGL